MRKLSWTTGGIGAIVAVGLVAVYYLGGAPQRGVPAPVQTVYEGPWSDGETSILRLELASHGQQEGDGVWMTGLHMKLADGWKTYWRIPGDSGLAPQFDWSGSENLSAAEVIWPAPRVFEEAGDRFYGYKGDVIWPLRITPIDPAAPVTLRLNLRYGVCSDVCVPVSADASLGPLLPGAPIASPHEHAVTEALARKIRNAGLEQIAVSASLSEVDGYRAKLHLDVSENARDQIDALVIEGPPDTYFSRSSMVSSGLYTISVEADNAASLRGAPVRITLLNEEGRVAFEAITQIE